MATTPSHSREINQSGVGNIGSELLQGSSPCSVKLSKHKQPSPALNCFNFLWQALRFPHSSHTGIGRVCFPLSQRDMTAEGTDFYLHDRCRERAPVCTSSGCYRHNSLQRSDWGRAFPISHQEVARIFPWNNCVFHPDATLLQKEAP